MTSPVGGLKTATPLKDLSIEELRENFAVNFDANYCNPPFMSSLEPF